MGGTVLFVPTLFYIKKNKFKCIISELNVKKRYRQTTVLLKIAKKSKIDNKGKETKGNSQLKTKQNLQSIL